MKIALTISGQPRRYRNGFKELKRWFLDRYDIDVYLHAWQDKQFKKYDFFKIHIQCRRIYIPEFS